MCACMCVCACVCVYVSEPALGSYWLHSSHNQLQEVDPGAAELRAPRATPRGRSRPLAARAPVSPDPRTGEANAVALPACE